MESMFIFGFIVFLCVLLSLFFVMLAEKSNDSREKSSPYECGFDPFMSARGVFSVRFFLLSVYFVVFDVELCLLVPVVCSVSFCSNIISLISFFSFFFILFLGLFHEYREGSLEWVI
nr:NADH dehydrogenase subunit 3 [Vignadula atrata]